MVDHLAYGDIIRIYCTLQDIQDKNTKSERSSAKIAGFLLSKGFADNNIYFLKSKKFTEFEFRNSLFEILPYSSFEIHDQNRERLKKLSKNPGSGKDQDDENIKSRMDTEKEQFKNKINKNRGLNINFDSEVVIRHVNSESFLQGEFSCPETGIGSFKLVLTDKYSSLIKFKIIRFRNSDKEAEEIQSKDEFRLHHCASHCFLNIGNQDDEMFLDKPVRVELEPESERRQMMLPANTDEISLDRPARAEREPKNERKQMVLLPTITDIFDEASVYHSMRPMIKKPTSTSESGSLEDVPKRYEVVNQSKATLILNFMPEKSSKSHNEPEKGEGKKQADQLGDIQHNDIVYLKNTKNDSYLTVDLWNGEVYLKQDKNCYEGLWEVCVKRDPQKGSIVSNAGRTFYLKHYITDAVAKVTYDEAPRTDSIVELDEAHSILGDQFNRNDTQKQLELNNRNLSIKVDPRPDQRAKVMRLLKYPDSKKRLKHRDLVVLSVMTLEESSGKELHQSKTDVKKEVRVREDLQETRKLFIDIADPIKKIHMTDILKKSDDGSNSFKLKLCKGDIENTFQIFKFDQKLLRNINKILSCQEAFAKFCDILIVFNQLLRKQSEMARGVRPDHGIQSDIRGEAYHRAESVKRHRNSITLNINSPKGAEEVAMFQAATKTKEDHVEGFFNKYLNSYILLTLGDTTQYLIKNSKSGSKTEFEFIIMIRSLGVIEILIQIIYFIEQILSQWETVFKGSSHSDNNISKRKYEKDRLSEIFKDVYRLMTVLSAEKSCKIYMARWLHLFLKQYYKLKKEFMHEFILQVLQDPFIIKNCIKEDNIQECIIELHKNFSPEAPEEKYLQLLSAFCRNKSVAVSSNQVYIMNHFLRPNEECVFRFEMKKTEDDQQNQDRKSSITPKEDIKIVTKNKKLEETEVSMTDHNKFRKKELWTYTVTLLNLIADASFEQPIEKQVLHRQPTTNEKSLIGVNVVTAFFKNYKEEDVVEEPDAKSSKANNNIFEPFLKLAHYYIKEQYDGSRRQQRNETVIVWDESRSNDTMNYSYAQEDQQGSESGIDSSERYALFEMVIEFFKYLFSRELEYTKYSVKRLRTIETSLDFIKTIMRTQEVDFEGLIRDIIMSVMKLKSSVIYDGVNPKTLYEQVKKKHEELTKENQKTKEAEPLRNATTMETEENERKQESSAVPKQKEKDNFFEGVDKIIETNCKRVVADKEKLRLLIDTRSRAAEILDIYLDIQNNKRLSDLVNKVFLKLYKNDFDTGDDANEPYSHRYKLVHEDTWVKEIIRICSSDPGSRLRDVRCLIECIFVDSLKVVDKMIVLMFKMYESRELLLKSFSNTFICYERFYIDAYKDAKAWIASFERIKENGDFSGSMAKLREFSYMLRKPTPKRRHQHTICKISDDEDAFGDADPHVMEEPTNKRTHSLDERQRLQNEQLQRQQQEQAQKKQDMAAAKQRKTLVLNERETRFTRRQEQLQKLFINIKLHEFVMKYAKSVKLTSDKANEDLDTIYEFLTLLVYDNPRNKSILLDLKYLEIWEKHIKQNYKATDLLREMLRNNKNILFNKELVTRIVRMVLQLSIEKENEDYVLRAKLLEVLRVCCMYNNRVHSDNQTIILSLLQNKRYFDRVMFSSINYALCRKIDRTPQVLDVFNVFQNGVPATLHSVAEGSESDDIRFLTEFDEEPPVEDEPEPEAISPEGQLLNSPEILQEDKEKPLPPSNYSMLTTYLREYRVKYEEICSSKGTTSSIQIQDFLQYVISFFGMMTALVDEKHKINVGKCSNIHPYDSLLVLLEDSAGCWPLARYVRAYINRLYYENIMQKSGEEAGPSRSNSQISITRELKLKTEFFLDKIFEEELPLLSQHLQAISNELHNPKNFAIVEQVRIDKPVRYEFVASYLYMYFVETLSGLKSILITTQFKNLITNKLKESSSVLHVVFAEMMQCIGEIYKRYRHIQDEPFVKKTLWELFRFSMEHLIEKLDPPQFNQFADMSSVGDSLTFPQADPEEEKLLRSSSQACSTRRRLLYAMFVEERDDRTNKRDIKDDPEDLFVEEFAHLRLNPKISQGLESDEEVQLQVNDLLSSVISRIRNTDKIKQMAEDELNELVELCCDLDCRSDISTIPLKQDGSVDEPKVLYKVITENVFLEQVIKLVTKSPDHLQTSVKIKTIRFLRLIFEKKVNSKCGLSNKKKWESSYFKKGREKEHLEEVQEYFKKLKLGEMIVKILQTDNAAYELLMETFMIGVCFLFNGNSRCQESILLKLQENPENEVMTQLCQFIRNIRNDIETEKFRTEEKMETKTDDKQGLPEQRLTMTDSYNYYDKELNCMMQARQDKDTTSQSLGEVSKKIRCVCQAYNFLQLLCENDNTALKDFLRQQINLDKTTKYNSVNFLAETTKLFKIVLEKLARHEKQKYLIEYMTEFVIEVTQIPCITNQRELCNTSIFQDIRSYIDKEIDVAAKDVVNESVLYLMDFVINVGLSLLEGNEDTIYDNLLKSLDAKFLCKILTQQDSKLKELKARNAECPTIEEINEQTLRVLMKDDPSSSSKEIRQRLQLVFSLLALIKKLSHYQTKKKKKPTLLSEMTDKSPEARKEDYIRFNPDVVRNLCNNYIEHIEVAHNNKKQYLYFPKLPIFSEISIQTQEYINENVKRQTQIDKVTDFLSKSQEVNNEMNWNYKVQNRLNSSSKTLDELRRNITILTIIIEVIFIVFSTINFTLNREKKEVVKMIRLGWVSSLLHLLAIVQLFSSVYFLYVWVTLKYRLAVERQLQKNKTDIPMEEVEAMLIRIDRDQEFDLKHYWYCARLLYQHETEIYNTLFFVATSFSGYLFGYEYYSLMVFDILSRNKTLKNVIQAITLNMKQLFYVSLLILVFVYVFNMISIEFDLYLPYIYEAEEEKCEVLSDCIMSLYTSGIVGTKDQDLRLGRYFTDLLYIVIMELLFSNIVSGIMIDTFAQLRDHRKKIENDQQNQCFICGITKATIEKRMKEEADENSEDYDNMNNKGIFHHHTHHIHKQWNYIYYLYILRQKDITAYTGIEYAIKKQLDDDQYKWVPIEYEKNENDVDELLDLLSVKLKKRMEGGKELAIRN